ncbi:MAG TPA: hypothetical protein VFK88_05790 [Gallionella sp.]|nr:hypothetical protein [Gallionella sp.]
MKSTSPIALALSLSLAACGSSTIMTKNVADQATQYNLAMEKHNNEVLLLNILRASQRRPLYFTAMAKSAGFHQPAPAA